MTIFVISPLAGLPALARAVDEDGRRVTKRLAQARLEIPRKGPRSSQHAGRSALGFGWMRESPSAEREIRNRLFAKFAGGRARAGEVDRSQGADARTKPEPVNDRDAVALLGPAPRRVARELRRLDQAQLSVLARLRHDGLGEAKRRGLVATPPRSGPRPASAVSDDRGTLAAEAPVLVLADELRERLDAIDLGRRIETPGSVRAGLFGNSEQLPPIELAIAVDAGQVSHDLHDAAVLARALDEGSAARRDVHRAGFSVARAGEAFDL